jgi:ABC-type glycerol-3-phosphate transport system substrate-binding protein
MDMKPTLLVRIIMLTICLVLVASGCSIIAPQTQNITLRIAFRKTDVDLQPLLDAYTRANPYIKIETVEGNSGSGAVNSAIQAKTLDIIRDDRGALQYAASGQLLPLEEMVHGTEWSKIRSDYFKGAWEGLQIEGRQWGVPASIDVFVTYVNMDALTALGLESPPLTWKLDDFLMLANSLNQPQGTTANSGQRMWGFCTDTQNYDPVLFVYLMGGTLIDDINKPTKPTLDSPETIAAVKWYADMITTYKVAPSDRVMRSLFSGGAHEAAVRGFCGIWLDMFSARGGPASNKWTFNWRLLPLPSDRARFRFGDEEGYYIVRTSEHPQEALALIRYLSDQWQASGPKLPARKSLATDTRYVREVGQDVAAAGIADIDTLIILPAQAGPVFQQLGEVFLAAINQIIESKGDPAAVLYKAQQQLLPLFTP